MARKKIVFIIVEGPSDKTVIGTLFNRIYDSSRVYVHVMHRDITTEMRVTPHNILSKLGNELKKYRNSNHFSNSDFQEVIHIVDMDGAYIPNTCIIENPEAKKPIYSTGSIETKNVNNIVNRNAQKRSNLELLYTSDKLCKTIPYRIFYMSCNLDHVLYGKLNSSNEEKENDAYNFAERYKNNVGEFKRFIASSDFSVVMGYRESWEFIKLDNNSLKRYTNLGLCFRDSSLGA